MREIKDTCYKGTRIILGNEKRDMINKMVSLLKRQGFEELSIPIIQYQEYFKEKVGEENKNMMFNFSDAGGRSLCLAPEYTAIVQELAKTHFKPFRDIKIFYVQECFRGERPQAGRYREFTQFGVEIMNPTKDYSEYLVQLAQELIIETFPSYKEYEQACFVTNTSAKRGLDYYKEGKGFEISCDKLGAQKQVCGGGEYDGGIGFALGVDRLILIK
jgi:histidyl-tRNA synthetase